MKNIKINKFIFAFCFIFLINYTLLFKTYAFDSNNIISDEDIIYDNLSTDNIKNTNYFIRDYSNKIIGSNCNIVVKASNDGAIYLSLEAATDDDIIKLVPKQFFVYETNKLLIGQEWGFYIKTTFDNNFNSYISTVLVFDISTESKLEKTIDRVITEIKPIFEYKFISVSKDSTIRFDGIKFEANDNECIIPYPTLTIISSYISISYEMVNDYYLSDICFSGSVFNEQYLNYGDNGYNPLDDYGSFITQFDYSFDGLYRKNGSFDMNEGASVLVSDAMALLGSMKNVPVVGAYLSGISEIYNISSLSEGNISFVQSTIDSFINGKIESSSNKYTAKCNYLNRKEQLENYKDSFGNPMLIKNMTFSFNDDTKQSIWYGVGNRLAGYFYVNNGALDNMVPNYSRFTNEIAMKVVSKNDVIETASIGVLTSHLYESNLKQVEIDKEISFYTLPKGTEYFKFSPIFSSDYTIEIDSNEDVELYIGNKKIIGNQIRTNYYVALYEQIDFMIISDNSKAVGSVRIIPNEDISRLSLIKNETDYIIKINNLSGIKQINTNNESVVITNIMIYEDEMLSTYKLYGYYKVNSCIDYILNENNYYIVLSNKTAVLQQANISVNDVRTIDKNSTIGLKKENFNYYILNNINSGNYVITLNGVKQNNYSVKAYNDQFKLITVTKCSNNCFMFSTNYSEQIVIGVYSEVNEENIDFILNLDKHAYSWKITGGNLKKEGLITFDDSILLPTNYTYYFSFLINDNIYHTTIKSKSYSYGTDINNNDNSLTLHDDTPIGGTGIEIRASFEGEYNVSFDQSINVIPTFNSKINDLNSFNEADGFGFKFSIPKFAIKCDYILSYGNSSTNTISNFINFNQNTYCKENITNACDSKWASPTNVKITISKLYVETIDDKIEIYDCNYTTTVNNMFYSGNGTTNDPYVIKYFRHFNNIRKTESGGVINYSFILDSDIVIPNEYKNSFLTFGEFNATFNGNHKTIKNLSYTVNTSVSKQGLFSTNNGVIKYLNLLDFDCITDDYMTSKVYYVGSICGINNGSILNCTVESYNEDIKYSLSKNSYQGGICGWNAGTISNCEAKVYYSKGFGNKAGIVGYNTSTGKINECISRGIITNNYYSVNQNEIFYVGGIAAVNYGVVYSCFNYASIKFECEGSVSGNRNIQPRMGTIIGLNEGSYSKVGNGGDFNTGDLENVTWTTGALWWKKKYNHDQKLYAKGTYCGESK